MKEKKTFNLYRDVYLLDDKFFAEVNRNEAKKKNLEHEKRQTK
ncbi:MULTISPECIES: hypothetical protein [Carboxydothermus]|uniref:Uncharacterized protein n=2 Tax=Carboxydothermus TaxID=129957 RepID=Q3AC35_CARHZ|nr:MULTISPECIES: hypothetical protein [Carboxydothermus]ABB15150.1 hypothetical protein CHY_1467 [Carboxydothermus hydrogenoformans Z-2901]NYE58236.1 hypothetical protein [Carboxydothermus ferrireducens DSM 11255]